MTRSAPSSSSLDEARDLVEVVREVGVAHDDVVAAGGGEAGEVGAAVAAARLVDDARAGRGGELGAAVLGGVVGDDDLAGDPLARAARRGPAPTTALDVLLLVEAGDHHGQRQLLRRMGGHRRSVAVGTCSIVLMRTSGRGPRDRTGPVDAYNARRTAKSR